MAVPCRDTIVFFFLFFFNVIIVVNSSDLKDPYSNMVAGQATPSGVFGNDNEGKDQDLTVKKHCKSVVAIRDRLDCLREIVEFCIPGYLGPSKECGMEVRLMLGKFFMANYECICSFVFFATTIFKTENQCFE